MRFAWASRVVIHFWAESLHSNPTPDMDGDSQRNTVLRSDGLPCRLVLVRGQLDRELVEVGLTGDFD